MADARLSQHPVDVLIRRIIAGLHAATSGDVDQIVERIATAHFDPRLKAVPAELPAGEFEGKRLEPREPAIVVHLLTRVFVDDQWSPDTSADDYLADLRAAARVSQAHLGLFVRRGGSMAAVIAETEAVVPLARRGTKTLPHLLVLFSADRGIIVSGYQFSEMSAVSMPEDIRWLR